MIDLVELLRLARLGQEVERTEIHCACGGEFYPVGSLLVDCRRCGHRTRIAEATRLGSGPVEVRLANAIRAAHQWQQRAQGHERRKCGACARSWGVCEIQDAAGTCCKQWFCADWEEKT